MGRRNFVLSHDPEHVHSFRDEVVEMQAASGVDGHEGCASGDVSC